MSNIERCKTCQGAKIIKGLGMLEHKCEPCKGIGWISIDEVLTTKNGKETEPVVVKKRGRRKVEA
jgi:phage FluMu protein Com